MDAPTVIYEDNKAAIDLSQCEPMYPCDARKEIVLAKNACDLNPADLFTKALAYDKFDLSRRLLGVGFLQQFA
eukprot:1700683-Rhodomonas_salina.1